ncbi:hypothetical protein GCM10022251_22540 [Phytohabitans flavus]|uniref:Solute-binding protein family 5 domain-containing protein n=1 Tax=Phytohabitans flavus TaxID=1076124 RepID=A0A6F8XRV4_9ACTN|nr:ABC transporter substrate-binding protein [Phytohabitans flavus]BCB76565.1 hypothetical protein Pflav_029750 [Phytohabitans flavus]
MAVVLAGTLGLAACQSSGGSDADSSANGPSGDCQTAVQAGAPKTGGNVTMLVNGLSAKLDPANNQLWSFTDGPVMSAIYGNLVYLDPQTGDANYYLLKTMTPNADFTVWTMTLNPNIKFSDGTPLNAEAIMFNYQRIADPASGAFYGPLARQFKMRVVDELNLEVTLPHPNAYLPKVIAENLGAIGSPTAIKAAGKEFGIKPVGAGPFKLESLNPGQTIKVVRNPYFSSFKAGQPYLDSITYQYLPDLGQQRSALQGNQAQIAAPTGGNANNMLKAVSTVNHYCNYTGGGQNLLMNTKKPPFDDPDARTAIALALDRKAAANAFATGTPPAKNLFSEHSPFYDAKYDWPAQNRQKAQELFDKLAAAGKPVDFVYTTISSPQQAPMASYLQAELATYKNVKITVKAVPAAQYTQDNRDKNYQMLPHGLYMVPAVPDATDYFGTGAVLNTFGWENSTANTAIEEIVRTNPSDTATLKKNWGVVQEQMLAENPVYFAGVGVLGFISSKQLTGVHPINYCNYLLWGEVGYRQ